MTSAELDKIKQNKTEQAVNILGDEVDIGFHVCVVCKERRHHVLMQSTQEPKVCVGCNRDL
jgi:hypothetical protein